jgi:hypothetical protein
MLTRRSKPKQSGGEPLRFVYCELQLNVNVRLHDVLVSQSSEWTSRHSSLRSIRAHHQHRMHSDELRLVAAAAGANKRAISS